MARSTTAACDAGQGASSRCSESGTGAWLFAVLATLAAAVALFATPTNAQNAAYNRQLGSEAIVPLRTHSLYAPYVESDLQNKFWDFGGDAIVDTNTAVRLTQDRPSQAGWLWSRLPLTVDNFEIQVEFKIDGRAHGSHPYGDGMALWLTEERAQSGTIFGNKDYFTGVGIMFDTFANSRHVRFDVWREGQHKTCSASPRLR